MVVKQIFDVQTNELCQNDHWDAVHPVVSVASR